MTYRAKCQLCNSIMDYRNDDIIMCKCGEVILDGKQRKIVCATDDKNFVEVDDQGNIIVLSPVDIPIRQKPSRNDLIEELDSLIKYYEDLPAQAMTSHITHYDLLSVMMIIKSIFQSE